MPESNHKYLIDFKLRDGVYLEVKGRLTSQERKKYLLITQQHPEITLHFLFGNPQNKLYKGSPTTYAQWAEKNGFEYTTIANGIPQHWIKKSGNNK